ncbi:MAG: type II toxin-antitoxin system VapC family toxin [Chloroflexi bacterium]|jgi:predicted nucleic acid-binding protein|nr:type II toxin-antitoxin system VapC family toxin [Chloroflexota bacterium]
MEIVIDTSVLVGMLVPNDHWHQQAVELGKAIQKQAHSPVYLDCVVAEALSVIVRRLEEKGLSAEIDSVLKKWNAQIPSDAISWVFPDVPRLYAETVGLVQSSAGALNFNDALISLACRERGIESIASFDHDFDQIDWLERLSVPEDITP